MGLSDTLRQLSILMSLPMVWLACLAAAVVVIARDWRTCLFAFGLLFPTVALLLSQSIPIEWALLQAVVGPLVAIMFYFSARQVSRLPLFGSHRETRWPQLSSLATFRILVLLLVALAFISERQSIRLPLIGPPVSYAAVWLVLVGLVGIGLHDEPLHAGLSLFTTVAGLLLLLLPLRPERMLVGLVGAWQLMLGLAISYLIVSRGLSPTAAATPDRRTWWQP